MGGESFSLPRGVQEAAIPMPAKLDRLIPATSRMKYMRHALCAAVTAETP